MNSKPQLDELILYTSFMVPPGKFLPFAFFFLTKLQNVYMVQRHMTNIQMDITQNFHLH